MGRAGRRKDERPDSFRSSTVGIVMPPTGPNVADLRPDSICGVDVECFSARRWRMGAATVGELGTSSVVRVIRFEEFVLRLSWLGLRFMGAIVGLMKAGEQGSDNIEEDEERELAGGWMERPFMFLRRLGPGEVMGRPWFGSAIVSLAMLDKPPKEAGAKLGRLAR